MITYTYKCIPCDHTFEIMSKMSETTRTSPCPKCNQDSNKVMVPSSFICERADGTPKKIYKSSQNPTKPWY